MVVAGRCDFPGQALTIERSAPPYLKALSVMVDLDPVSEPRFVDEIPNWRLKSVMHWVLRSTAVIKSLEQISITTAPFIPTKVDVEAVKEMGRAFKENNTHFRLFRNVHPSNVSRKELLYDSATDLFLNDWRIDNIKRR